jgi:hypothetical protein
MVEKVRIGLQEAKRFWQERDLWPSVTPREVYGPAVLSPDDGSLADGTSVRYSTAELHAGFGRVIEDKSGVAGRDRIRLSLADEDTRRGGTLRPSERVPQPLSLVEEADRTVRCYRSPVAGQLEEDDCACRIVAHDVAVTDARPGLRNLPDEPPEISVPE